MSSVINTDLIFSDSYGSFISPVGGVYYMAQDSFVLIGSAVSLEDQQHENNVRGNYLSYRIKHVKIRGEGRIRVDELPVKCGKFTVVLYKVPVKYENGVVVPRAVIDGGILRPKNYILCSDPQSVLSWKIFSYRYLQYDGRYWLYSDFSLSYNRQSRKSPSQDYRKGSVHMLHL